MLPDRYLRHQMIDWLDQDLLRAQRLVVVGAGAVGNEVVKGLVLLGVGRVDLYDLDTVESHNLTRSVLLREGDVGRPKAECVAERADELDPTVEVVAHHGDFWHTLDLATLRAASCVFACVDSFEARIRLNRLCALLRVDLVNTALDSRRAVVEVFPFTADHRVPCYECGLPGSVYQTIAQRYSCGWLRRVALAERKVPTTIVTAGVAGALAVGELLRGLTAGGVRSARRTLVDTLAGTTTVAELPLRPGCPGCDDLDRPRLVLDAARTISRGLFSGAGFEGLTLQTSEPILTRFRCRTCDGEAFTTVLRPASDLDDTFALCPACGERSRELELKDQLSPEELLERYAGLPLPGKYLTCKTDDVMFVLELKEARDV